MYHIFRAHVNYSYIKCVAHMQIDTSGNTYSRDLAYLCIRIVI